MKSRELEESRTWRKNCIATWIERKFTHSHLNTKKELTLHPLCVNNSSRPVIKKQSHQKPKASPHAELNEDAHGNWAISVNTWPISLLNIRKVAHDDGTTFLMFRLAKRNGKIYEILDRASEVKRRPPKQAKLERTKRVPPISQTPDRNTKPGLGMPSNCHTEIVYQW